MMYHAKTSAPADVFCVAGCSLREMMLSCGQMMCALRHNGRLRRLYHFRRSRNIIAQHIICRTAANLIAQLRYFYVLHKRRILSM